MPTTYEPIATTTLGTATNQITFSSIPSTYTDLRVVWVPRDGDGAAPYIRFNNDSNGNYTATYLRAYGSLDSGTTGASSVLQPDYYQAGPQANEVSLWTADIFAYASTTLFKVVLLSTSADRNGSGHAGLATGTWRSTSAITSIQLFLSSGNQGIGTTATLYGIKAA